jgi:hypothetical protein
VLEYIGEIIEAGNRQAQLIDSLAVVLVVIEVAIHVLTFSNKLKL